MDQPASSPAGRLPPQARPLSVRVMGPAQEAGYQNFLLCQPQALFYHGLKYLGFLEQLLGCRRHCLLASRGEEIAGVLPLMALENGQGRVYNSLPYFGSNGGILAAEPPARQALVEAYNRLAGDESTLAATLIANPLCGGREEGLKHTHQDWRISQVTELPQGAGAQQGLLDLISPSARRNIRKAQAAGLTVEKDPGQLALLEAIHRQNMADLGGLAKGPRFFELLPRHFTDGQDYDLWVARQAGQVVAALLVFYFNLTAEYYTPVISAEHRPLQPLSLILQTALLEAQGRGCRWWNWGGTWRTQEGVFRFKNKWGARVSEYRYYTQLNRRALLGWTSARILETFPGFYVVPFAALEGAP